MRNNIYKVMIVLGWLISIIYELSGGRAESLAGISFAESVKHTIRNFTQVLKIKKRKRKKNVEIMTLFDTDAFIFSRKKRANVDTYNAIKKLTTMPYMSARDQI